MSTNEHPQIWTIYPATPGQFYLADHMIPHNAIVENGTKMPDGGFTFSRPASIYIPADTDTSDAVRAIQPTGLSISSDDVHDHGDTSGHDMDILMTRDTPAEVNMHFYERTWTQDGPQGSIQTTPPTTTHTPFQLTLPEGTERIRVSDNLTIPGHAGHTEVSIHQFTTASAFEAAARHIHMHRPGIIHIHAESDHVWHDAHAPADHAQSMDTQTFIENLPHNHDHGAHSTMHADTSTYTHDDHDHGMYGMDDIHPDHAHHAIHMIHDHLA